MILGRPLLGDAGGNPGVKLLQESLRKLAFNTQQSSVDPAMYTGQMTLGTVIALANAAPVLGGQVHSVVAAALNVVALIRAPIELIPYADAVLDVVLSPWIIDDVYGVILSIIRLFPGGGGAATAIDNAVNTVKSALTTAATPIATAITAATPSASTPTAPSSAPPMLGEARAGFTWVAATATTPGHWERLRPGQVPVPGPDGAMGPTVRDHRGAALTPVARPPTPSFPAGYLNSGVIVRDHRTWPKGRLISPDDWNGLTIYEGRVALDDLNRRDANFWRNATQEGANNREAVASGRAPFKVFLSSSNGSRMGAFYNGATQMLRIYRVPRAPSPKGHWYDFFVDGVEAVVDAAADVADAVEAAWDWVAENAAEVYNAVKKYGCLVVNNDIVVAAAAGAAGIVATPAASASVVAAAGSGRAACTALAIGEAVFAIIKFLSTDFAAPPPLTTATPPSPKQGVLDQINQYAPRDRSLHVVMTAPASAYPPGCVTRFNTTRQLWSVYCPADTQLGGAAMLTAYEMSPVSTPASVPTKGSVPNAVFVWPTSPANTTPPTTPVMTAPTVPSTVTPAPVDPYPIAPTSCPPGTTLINDQCVVSASTPWPEPFYKNWKFWAAVGGGVIVVGTGGYLVFRRKPSPPVAGRRRRRR